MKTNRLPKSFEIMGQKIKVVKRKTLLSSHQAFGETRFIANEIHVQTSQKGAPVTEDQVQVTYLHEVMHVIFTAIGRQDLNQDESLVDLVAQCLHQIRKSEKY